MRQGPLLVQDLMTSPVLTIRADTPLLAVQEIMKWNHVRHVPVVSADGAVVGIVSQRDLLAAAVSTLSGAAAVDRRQHLAFADVKKVMKESVHTIESDQTVQAAAGIMRAHGVGSLPVVDDGQLVGIITDADLIRLVELLPDPALALVRTPLPRTGPAATVPLPA